QCRGGADYDARFGHRMRGTGTFADLLAQRFRVTCKRLELAPGKGTSGARTDLFTAPATARGAADKANTGQFELF
nr:radical SAM protein [Halioglobus sp.]